MTRFSTIFHKRIVKFGFEMRDAALEIRDARQEAKSAASKRKYGWFDDDGKRHAPQPSTQRSRRRRTSGWRKKEGAIARKYDMLRGWSADEYEKDFYKEVARRRR